MSLGSIRRDSSAGIRVLSLARADISHRKQTVRVVAALEDKKGAQSCIRVCERHTHIYI